jgi:hypothetical protein
MKIPFFVAAVCMVAACAKPTGQQSLNGQNGEGKASAQVGTTNIQGPACPPPTFANAVCVCGDLNGVGSGLVTNASDGGSANVGVNGESQVVGHFNIQGSWVAYQGARGTGDVNVRDSLGTTGNLQDVGSLSCGEDLIVGGNLSNVGNLTVGGTLRLAGKNTSLGTRNIHGTGPYTAPAGLPCGCDPASLLDIAGLVANAKAHNDNASLGIGTDIHVVGNKNVTLKTGQYYFTSIDAVGRFAANIDGAVAVYVDGNLDSVGDDTVGLSPGSTLDLYVSGRVRTVGHTSAG